MYYNIWLVLEQHGLVLFYFLVAQFRGVMCDKSCPELDKHETHTVVHQTDTLLNQTYEYICICYVLSYQAILLELEERWVRPALLPSLSALS